MVKQAAGFNRALGRMTDLLNSGLKPREQLESLIEIASQALGVRGCSLMLLDGEKKRLVHAVVRGLSERYVRKGLVEADKSLPEVLEGKAVKVTNAAGDPRIQFRELAAQEHIVSIIGVPVKLHGEVVGSLRAYCRTRREFTLAEEDFLATAANLAALVLEVGRLTEQKHVAETYAPVDTRSLMASSLRPSSFAHPSEEEFANLLDFYQIDWVYEPRSFPVQWEDGKVTEMFTPDFYLPALDMYIEMTTLKPGSTREKKRKIRRLMELYPDVKVKLLARRDYDRLLAKYGHGPLAGSKTHGIGRILYSSEQVQSRVRLLAKEISEDYEGRRPLLVGVLRGVFCFMADLMRYLSVPLEIDFMAISYYGSQPGGAVRITKDLDLSPEGRHIILVEDIVDTGLTLRFVLAHLRSRRPASVAVCTLLDKTSARLTDVTLTYVGFEVPDEFVVGYGLDFREEYRNLPFIALLTGEKEKTRASHSRNG
jgi:bifunctional protein TilS/HprT